MSNQKTFVRMFKPQFAWLVQAGLKCQTVRPVPKRMPQTGDRISLRMWEGLPYRSKQVVLKESVITAVESIEITPEGWVWIKDFRIKTRHDFEQFALADGFNTPEAFLEWFKTNHGLPFRGIVLKWRSSPEVE